MNMEDKCGDDWLEETEATGENPPSGPVHPPKFPREL
jgi:hypothetical protein